MLKFGALAILPFLLFACQGGKDVSAHDKDSINYNKKWGADSFGMKKYFMVLLHKGPNRDKHSKTEKERIQKAHMENIGRLAKEGKIVLAGPFLDDFKTRGIFIFNVKDSAEVAELLQSDEAIKTGRLVGEIHKWYGSAALMELNKWHASGVLSKK